MTGKKRKFDNRLCVCCTELRTCERLKNPLGWCEGKELRTHMEIHIEGICAPREIKVVRVGRKNIKVAFEGVKRKGSFYVRLPNGTWLTIGSALVRATCRRKR